MVPVALRRFLVDPRRRVALSLIMVWFSAAWYYGGQEFLWWPALCALVALGSELLWHPVSHRRLVFNYSSLVTGLLIGLIVYPTSSGYLWLVLPAASILLKRLLYVRGRPLLNPAGLVVVLSALVFNTPTSWWGFAWSPWIGLALALSVLDVLWKLKLWVVPAVFLLGYTLYLSWFGGLGAVWPLVFDGTVLAFAFVMLPEPKSGVQGFPLFAKVGFALCVVVTIALLSSLTTFSLDPMLTALLIADLLFGIAQNLRLRGGDAVTN